MSINPYFLNFFPQAKLDSNANLFQKWDKNCFKGFSWMTKTGPYNKDLLTQATLLKRMNN